MDSLYLLDDFYEVHWKLLLLDTMVGFFDQQNVCCNISELMSSCKKFNINQLDING